MPSTGSMLNSTQQPGMPEIVERQAATAVDTIAERHRAQRAGRPFGDTRIQAMREVPAAGIRRPRHRDHRTGDAARDAVEAVVVGFRVLSAGPGPGAAENRVGVRFLDIDQDVAAIEVGPDGRPDVIALMVAVACLAELAAQLHPLEMLLGLDVDDAGDGIGAVDRGGAVAQHFDRVDHRDRDVVQIDRVDRALIVGEREADAVDQDQGAFRAEVAQAEIGGAVAAVLCTARDAAGEVDRRDLLQDVFDRARLALLDLGRADHRDRIGAGRVAAADARTGHLDRLQGLRRLGGLRGRRGRRRRSRLGEGRRGRDQRHDGHRGLQAHRQVPAPAENCMLH